MIPVEWTDFAIAPQPKQASSAPTTPTLGSLADLLHARAVVDALLGRLAGCNSEMKSTTSKESAIAKKSEPLRFASPRNVPLGSTARRTQNGSHRHSGTHHREHNPIPTRPGEES